MGLQPLEFCDCLTDSPYFRDKLHAHEKELDRTSKAIKELIKDCTEVINAARKLSEAQRSFAKTLQSFKFDCIGGEEIEEERVISQSLFRIGELLNTIEEERDKILTNADKHFLEPLDKFRTERINKAKDCKKNFHKETAKFCQNLEKYLNIKTKSGEGTLKEADASQDMERKSFYKSSMHYVLELQEVQLRKKFELVEPLLTFMYSWLTFYHSGHVVQEEFTPYMTDIQYKIQKCRDNFTTTKEEATNLMHKMLDVRGTIRVKPHDQPGQSQRVTREGYLFVQEKKAFGTTWSKFYCQYRKESKILTMIPFNQMTGKGISTETVILTSCTRRASDSIERRFCFDITVQDRQGSVTLQALSDEDRKLWLDAMDGKEPIYNEPSSNSEIDGVLLDDIGFTFIKRCIAALDTRGLEEQGLYRVVGVNSKVYKLTNMGLDRRKADKIDFNDQDEWETKTVTSALKQYFRSLPEPIMSYKLHKQFVEAAKKKKVPTATLR